MKKFTAGLAATFAFTSLFLTLLSDRSGMSSVTAKEAPLPIPAPAEAPAAAPSETSSAPNPVADAEKKAPAKPAEKKTSK